MTEAVKYEVSDNVRTLVVEYGKRSKFPKNKLNDYASGKSDDTPLVQLLAKQEVLHKASMSVEEVNNAAAIEAMQVVIDGNVVLLEAEKEKVDRLIREKTDLQTSNDLLKQECGVLLERIESLDAAVIAKDAKILEDYQNYKVATKRDGHAINLLRKVRRLALKLWFGTGKNIVAEIDAHFDQFNIKPE